MGIGLQGLILEGFCVISDRKLQLFEVACGRRILHLLDELGRSTVELAEQAADSDRRIPENPLSTYGAIKEALAEYGPPPDFLLRPPLAPQTAAALEVAASLACPEQAGARVRYMGGWAATLAVLAAGTPKANLENDAQLGILYDVLGNPFRPASLDPAHRTQIVVSLAEAAYDKRRLPSGELDPHRLAVLADALEEVGAPGEVVAHLRSHGHHFRGCHVVDLCLGLS